MLKFVGISLMAAAVFAQSVPEGPGCAVNPASPSVGADVPETYFGPEPSTVQKEFIGRLQLLTAGKLDERAGTITLPLYRGTVRAGNRTVWYILTDTTDEGNAKALGLNFSAKLNYAAVSSRAVRTGTLRRDGMIDFDAGYVDFTPERRIVPNSGPSPFPPLVAEPGSVGDNSYSPLVRIVNAGHHIYNAPIVAAGDPSTFRNMDGTINRRSVLDTVVSINVNPTNVGGSTVTMRLIPGFSFARPVLYLSTDASTPLVAALEEATLAPGLAEIEVGNDDSAFSAVERIFVAINGPRGCENPQRQGIESAMIDGRRPLNVLGGIPTAATDYSPLWDLNAYQWTQQAIDRGYRSRLTEEFQILSFAERGFITGIGGEKFGSQGTIINCPIVHRFK
jgi:hypothetical protein